MTESYELLRSRAKAYLAVHVLRDPELAQLMAVAEREALTKLRSETAKRVKTGRIVSTQF